MPQKNLVLLLTLSAMLGLTACPPELAGPGESCVNTGDCESSLVCVSNTCRATCNDDDECSIDEHCTEGYCLPDAVILDAGPDQDAALADVANSDVVNSDVSSADHVQTSDSGQASDAGHDDVTGQDSQLADDAAIDAGEIDAGTSSQCITVASGSYQHLAIDSQSDLFEIVWDVTPFDDASTIIVALALSPPADPDWTDLATLVSFNHDNLIQVRNAATYVADLSLSYVAGENYHLREVVDLTNHSYSVFVTPPASQELALASDYAFRTEQNTVASLNTMTLKSTAGSMQACLVSLHAVERPVEVTITPSSVNLEPEATQQFSANVRNAGDSAVNWSVEEANCGSINATGLYTAPVSEKTCHVRATSVEDSSAFALASVIVAEVSQENPYLEPVNIPVYDSSNPKHCLIPDDAPWTAETLNSSTWEHFFVRPGDYLSVGQITITASGSAGNRRTISLYNGNNTHPGALPRDVEHLARVRLKLSAASYWTIDRMAAWDFYGDGIIIYRYSTHNIINRFYTWYINGSVFVRHGADDNTIQNSRFEDMRQCDSVAVLLGEFTGFDNVLIQNTKVINNEFYNQNDGFMPVRFMSSEHPELRQIIDVPGTIVDSNQFYIDDDTAPTTENAIDLKTGSYEATNPMVITNNIIWGYTGQGNRGDTAMSGHFNVPNTKFNNNIYFDCKCTFSAGSGGPPDNDGEPGVRTGFCRNSEVKGNLIYRCGGGSMYPFKQSALDTSMEENVFIDCLNGFGEFSGNNSGTTFQNNDICNTPNEWNNLGGNASAFVSTIANNNHYSTAEEAGYTEDFVFTADKFTSHPREIRLEHAVKPN